MAVRLGVMLKRPVIHLDKYFWQNNWVAMEAGIWRDRVRRMVTGDEWIIDGNFDSSLDIRLPRADTVIFLDFSTGVCLRRICKRILTSYGRVREDMAEGCPERVDIPFIKWVWRFRRDIRPDVYGSLGKYFDAEGLIILRNPLQVEEYLKSIGSIVTETIDN